MAGFPDNIATSGNPPPTIPGVSTPPGSIIPPASAMSAVQSRPKDAGMLWKQVVELVETIARVDERERATCANILELIRGPKGPASNAP